MWAVNRMGKVNLLFVRETPRSPPCSFSKTDKGDNTVLPILLRLTCSGFLPFIKTAQSASGPQRPLDKHSQSDTHSEFPSPAAPLSPNPGLLAPAGSGQGRSKEGQMCETQVFTLADLSPGAPTALQAGGLPKASPPPGVRAATAREGKAGSLTSRPRKSGGPSLPPCPSSHSDRARQSGLLACWTPPHPLDSASPE